MCTPQLTAVTFTQIHVSKTETWTPKACSVKNAFHVFACSCFACFQSGHRIEKQYVDYRLFRPISIVTIKNACSMHKKHLAQGWLPAVHMLSGSSRLCGLKTSGPDRLPCDPGHIYLQRRRLQRSYFTYEFGKLPCSCKSWSRIVYTIPANPAQNALDIFGSDMPRNISSVFKQAVIRSAG